MFILYSLCGEKCLLTKIVQKQCWQDGLYSENISKDMCRLHILFAKHTMEAKTQLGLLKETWIKMQRKLKKSKMWRYFHKLSLEPEAIDSQ